MKAATDDELRDRLTGVIDRCQHHLRLLDAPTAVSRKDYLSESLAQAVRDLLKVATRHEVRSIVSATLEEES